MIRKLKWKFVGIMMTIITILLVIIFSILYYSSKTGYVQRSINIMHSILADDRSFPIDPRAPRRPDPFLIVEKGADGTVTVLKNGPNIAQEDIETLINTAELSDRTVGEIQDQYLRFMRGHRPEGTRYVFLDTYTEAQALQWQIIHSCLIGTGAFVILFIISVLLAGWVARPAEDAWNKQRQFVADASHELKTPLTVILANTKILADSQEITGEKNLLRLDNIGAEAVRMKTLIEHMLTLARTDAGIAAGPLAPVDFSLLANQCIATFEPLFFEAGKEISCTVEEHVWVKGDEKKLVQLMAVLMDNACKYSRPGSVIDIALKICNGKDVVFSVTSEGTPLSEEEQKRIFDRFYRLSPSRTDVPGYGLGLSIAAGIAKEHRGKLWVDSDGIAKNCFSFRMAVFEV